MWEKPFRFLTFRKWPCDSTSCLELKLPNYGNLLCLCTLIRSLTISSFSWTWVLRISLGILEVESRGAYSGESHFFALREKGKQIGRGWWSLESLLRLECSKSPWNCDRFLLPFLTSNNGSTGSCISSVCFRDEYRILCPCLSSPISLSDDLIYSPFYYSLPLETRFLSAKDSRNPDLSLSLVFFFCCVLLHRWASVNVAAGSSLEVSGLWIYVRRSCVHPCHSSCIQKCGNHDILLVCVSLQGTSKKMRLMLNIFYGHHKKYSSWIL